MSDLVLALVADYGVAIVFASAFLSCLALPVPTSLLMLASGGFAATGDLILYQVVTAAFVGAVLGDNAGYWIARTFEPRVTGWLSRNVKRNALRQRSQTFMQRWGGSSVFFSCWLVAPLGPYVNYVSGLTRFNWLRFALWGFAGEVVWVGLYVGLGYLFAENVAALASLMGNLSGMLAALVVVIGLGAWLWRAGKKTTGKVPPRPHI